jgi:RecB family exonuclease
VPAGLPALRDDHVHAGRHGPPCFLGRADRVHDNAPGVVDLLDVAAGITQEKRHDPQASVKGLVKAAVTIFGEDEVAAERPRGQRRRLPDHGSDVV